MYENIKWKNFNDTEDLIWNWQNTGTVAKLMKQNKITIYLLAKQGSSLFDVFNWQKQIFLIWQAFRNFQSYFYLTAVILTTLYDTHATHTTTHNTYNTR